MPRRLSPLIGVAFLLAGAAAAAEPTLTPRAPPTALVPAAKSGGPSALPPPRAPAPPNPINVGTLITPPPAPSFTAPPPPPPPAMVHAPVVKEPPKTITLKEVQVRGAAIKPPPAAAPPPPPRALKTAEPARNAARRRPAGDFSAWEKSCLLPDDLPPLSAPVKAGAKAQARVDVFMRRRPSCDAPILDVLERGETVMVERGKDGWWRVRNQKGGEFWVGERLLAPLQQP